MQLWWTGAICSTYEVNEVLIAVGMTAGVVFALTLFAMQTKIDFTAWGGGRPFFLNHCLLVSLSVVFQVHCCACWWSSYWQASLLHSFPRWKSWLEISDQWRCVFSPLFLLQNRNVRLVFAIIGAIIFSLYIVFDTQMMMGGNHKVSNICC